MKITSLVDNFSKSGLPTEHGLSLLIETNKGKTILFDMGQGQLFSDNAKALGISLKKVDLAVVSHGHYDHGGGLSNFMQINSKAPIYIQREAFDEHYSKRDEELRYIGLNQQLKDSERFVFCDELTHIDDDITLFAKVEGRCCNPHGNRLLFGADGISNDRFEHEQSMIISEGEELVLIAGCAHAGIVNIIRRAEQIAGRHITRVFAGMHLVKSGLNENEDNKFIGMLARKLMEYDNCQFFTMHCTGIEQYEKLKSIMGNRINYMGCGDEEAPS